MRSLKEQIANKCIHFNGVMNKCCKAGVNYDVFRGEERPFRFPCLKQGGECSLSQFLTDEEVDKKIADIEGEGMKTLVAYATIKDHFEKTGERSGKIACSCGGELSFAIARVNNHIWAKCPKCGIAFNE